MQLHFQIVSVIQKNVTLLIHIMMMEAESSLMVFPFLEPFSIIPAIAAVTDKLEFSTSVYKLAPRQAVTTAKFVTTLGVMTNNRFHFGVGVSPWYEDFLATGERWEKRGKRMDEQIHILKGLMNGEYFLLKVRFYDIPELKALSRPTNQFLY